MILDISGIIILTFFKILIILYFIYRKNVTPDGVWWNRCKPGACTTSGTTDQPEITVKLSCEELMTFTAITVSDLEISAVSDAESPLYDSNLDETPQKTRN